MSSTQKFLITWLLVLLSGWLTFTVLSYVGGLISILLTAALIAFVLHYPVNVLKSFLPRPIAATVVYLVSAVVVSLLLVTLLPPVINQAGQLIAGFPDLLAHSQDKLSSFQDWSNEHKLPVNVQILTSQLLTRIQSLAESLATTGVSFVLGTFNRFLDLILILVISFYMLIDGERLWKGLICFLNPTLQVELTASLKKNLQRFVTGQLFLGAFMAITLTVAFLLLQVPFFLLFSVFIGTMEVIPFIGASLGIGVVVIIVTFINGWLALKVLVVSVIIQQVKDNVISPKLMGSLTGLSPVLIFISLLLGAQIGGLLGIILAIPLTGVVKSLVEIVTDPNLPPQRGSFFQNPFQENQENQELAKKI